eukprot:3942641-Ditylum_brightwellii.AAC.1
MLTADLGCSSACHASPLRRHQDVHGDRDDGGAPHGAAAEKCHPSVQGHDHHEADRDRRAGDHADDPLQQGPH